MDVRSDVLGRLAVRLPSPDYQRVVECAGELDPSGVDVSPDTGQVVAGRAPQPVPDAQAPGAVAPAGWPATVSQPVWVPGDESAAQSAVESAEPVVDPAAAPVAGSVPGQSAQPGVVAGSTPAGPGAAVVTPGVAQGVGQPGVSPGQVQPGQVQPGQVGQQPGVAQPGAEQPGLSVEAQAGPAAVPAGAAAPAAPAAAPVRDPARDPNRRLWTTKSC